MKQIICAHCFKTHNPRGNISMRRSPHTARVCDLCGDVILSGEIVYKIHTEDNPTTLPTKAEIEFGGQRGGGKTNMTAAWLQRAGDLAQLVLAAERVISTYPKGPAKGFAKALVALETAVTRAKEIL